MAQLPYGRGTHVGPDAFNRQQESFAQREGAVAPTDGVAIDLRLSSLNLWTPVTLGVPNLDRLHFVPLAPLDRGYMVSHARLRFYAPAANSEVHTALYARSSRTDYAIIGATQTLMLGDAAVFVTNTLAETTTFPVGAELAFGVLGRTAAAAVQMGYTNVSTFPVRYLDGITALPSTVSIPTLTLGNNFYVPWVVYISPETAELY